MFAPIPHSFPEILGQQTKILIANKSEHRQPILIRYQRTNHQIKSLAEPHNYRLTSQLKDPQRYLQLVEG